MDGSEKRVFPRLSLNVDIDYRPVNDSCDMPIKSYSRNISAGGLCILTLEKYNPGTCLSLSFNMPGEVEPINTTGMVMWIKEFNIGDLKSNTAYDVGVEFVNLNEDDMRKISQYTLKFIG
jgi:uncharacterized protein (TIGR02266 family)